MSEDVGCLKVLSYKNTGICVCACEMKKKAKIFSPPAAGETPHPCHLSGPEMISNTFRHDTPSDTQHLGFPGGAAGAMDGGDGRGSDRQRGAAGLECGAS